MATGQLPLFIDEHLNIGIAPRRQPAFKLLVHLAVDPLLKLGQRKQPRLFAGIKAVVGHARFAEGFHHLRQLFFRIMIFWRNTEIR